MGYNCGKYKKAPRNSAGLSTSSCVFYARISHPTRLHTLMFFTVCSVGESRGVTTYARMRIRIPTVAFHRSRFLRFHLQSFYFRDSTNSISNPLYLSHPLNNESANEECRESNVGRLGIKLGVFNKFVAGERFHKSQTNFSFSIRQIGRKFFA